MCAENLIISWDIAFKWRDPMSDTNSSELDAENVESFEMVLNNTGGDEY